MFLCAAPKCHWAQDVAAMHVYAAHVTSRVKTAIKTATTLGRPPGLPDLPLGREKHRTWNF